MPNLRLIKTLHETYKPDSKFGNLNFDSPINESFESKKYERVLSENIYKLGSEYVNYFLLKKDADLYLLFIDMDDFSRRFNYLNNYQLSGLLDDYYRLIIPIIYKHGGEIDKIMGDGIICIFGQPFFNAEREVISSKVNECAMEIINVTKGTRFISKVAINYGTIMYYQNKSIHYEEFTVIGKPITELYRLESISEKGKINFFTDSEYDNFLNKHIPLGILLFLNQWTLSKSIIITPKLKGVDRFDSRKHLTKI